MKRSWASPRPASPPTKISLFAAALVTAALLALVLACGCYEARNRRAAGNGAGTGTGGGGGEADKPYGLALLDVILPSDSAMGSCGNYGSSRRPLFDQEIEERMKGAQKAVEDLSDQLVPLPVTAIDGNCQVYKQISARARIITPDLAPSEKLRSKPVLHVRLLLWIGDEGALSGSERLFANEWADISALDAGFKRRISINYLALTGPKVNANGPNKGCFSEWRAEPTHSSGMSLLWFCGEVAPSSYFKRSDFYGANKGRDDGRGFTNQGDADMHSAVVKSDNEFREFLRESAK